jgi:predicted PhzF superfamily epimerase YddE/YHI9
MEAPLFQVDAFTDHVFAGNPAAVCPLPRWPDAGILQAIASENNLSETAFLVGSGHEYELRWFTPVAEVDLCGHATLASAFVLFERYGAEGDLTFHTRKGELSVRRSAEGLLRMDFPALPAESADPPEGMLAALGGSPAEVLLADDFLVSYADERAVRELAPDFTALRGVGARGVIVTAPGDTVDFVSRFFAPDLGIPEDPVTGSAHCTLAPYWAEHLGKSKLHARQVSRRGGELWCELRGERVEISGNAVLYLSGSINV